VRSLERLLDGTKDADRVVDAALLAATDSRDRILDEAERRAQGIIAKAQREADELLAPRRELEIRQREVDELIDRAERAARQADDEADRLLESARHQAERITAEARLDALAAIEESKREAEDWVHEARAEHQRVALMLRGLKAAVRDMLDEAVERNEAIKVVLAEDVVGDPTSVRLPN
jgi:cell division septum initiation protein DivIVA